MFNPVKAIGLKAQDMLEAFRVSVSEISKTRKYEHISKCDVLLVYPTGIGEWYHGLTDETNSFLFIPILMRMWQDLHPIMISPQKKLFICSNDNHSTLDLILLGRLAASSCADIRLKWKVNEKLKKILSYRWQYNTDVIEINVKKTPATMDLNLLNIPKYSADFTKFSFSVIQTKAFAFMDDVSNKTIILIAAVAGLFGMVLGGGLSFIAYFIISYYSK